jgi:cytochrome c553
MRNGVLMAALLVGVSDCMAQNSGRAPRIVTSYCSGCHGIDGNAELPYFPKLAGLNPTYAERKLTEFKKPSLPAVDELFVRPRNASDGKEPAWSPTREELTNMQGVAHAVKPGLIRQAVEWYAGQPRTAGRASNKALVEQGEQLFRNGPRDQKQLACVSCHGPEAEGRGLTPRLAGQNAAYIQAQLAKFRRGDQRSAPAMMAVARGLNADEVRAAAAYLQSK